MPRKTREQIPEPEIEVNEPEAEEEKEVEAEGPQEIEDILAAGAARQRKREDAGAASAAFDVKPIIKPKRILTEKQLENLKRAREAALLKKKELEELAQKAKACSTSAA